MKILLLCGGRGVIDPVTRARIPKCLTKIGNRPLIWHVMKLYSSYGYNDFVLALGQEGDQIKSYFANGFSLLHDVEVHIGNNHIQSLNKIPEENWNIKLIDTGNSANTGARISRCERYLKHETFLISYSDILSDVNISELLAFHQENAKTLTVTGVKPASRFGTFKLEGTVIDYEAQARIEMHNSRINGGFMVANSNIFEKLSPISECNLENEVFKNLVEEQNIAIYKHEGFWQNVDTERDVQYIQDLYDANKRPWLGIN